MITFYLCDTCGNLIQKIHDGQTTPSCCGHPMQELRPASTDGAVEKHVPEYIESAVYQTYDDENLVSDSDRNPVRLILVRVGSAPHPMTQIHHIQWIIIETDQGVYRKDLAPDMAPEALFALGEDETILNAYAYCNLHGLWMANTP